MRLHDALLRALIAHVTCSLPSVSSLNHAHPHAPIPHTRRHPFLIPAHTTHNQQPIVCSCSPQAGPATTAWLRRWSPPIPASCKAASTAPPPASTAGPAPSAPRERCLPPTTPTAPPATAVPRQATTGAAWSARRLAAPVRAGGQLAWRVWATTATPGLAPSAPRAMARRVRRRSAWRASRPAATPGAATQQRTRHSAAAVAAAWGWRRKPAHGTSYGGHDLRYGSSASARRHGSRQRGAHTHTRTRTGV